MHTRIAGPHPHTSAFLSHTFHTVSAHPEETSYDARNDVPMLLSTLLRRQVSALVSSTAHEIAAFTERNPAEEEALLCKALSAHLANRADLFRRPFRRGMVVGARARTSPFPLLDTAPQTGRFFKKRAPPLETLLELRKHLRRRKL